MAEYRTEKIDVLNEFGIELTASQHKHLKTLTSEVAIDNYARSLLMKYL